MADNTEIRQDIKLNTEFEAANGLKKLTSDISKAVESGIQQGLKNLVPKINESTKQAYREKRAEALGSGNSTHAMRQLRSSMSNQIALEEQARYDRSLDSRRGVRDLERKVKETKNEVETAENQLIKLSETAKKNATDIENATAKIKELKQQLKNLNVDNKTLESFDKQTVQIENLTKQLDNLKAKRQELLSSNTNKPFLPFADVSPQALKNEATRVRGLTTSWSNKLHGLKTAKESFLGANGISPLESNVRQLELIGQKSEEARQKLIALNRQIATFEDNVESASAYSKSFTQFKNSVLENRRKMEQTQKQLETLQKHQTQTLGTDGQFEKDRAEFQRLQQEIKNATTALETYKQQRGTISQREDAAKQSFQDTQKAYQDAERALSLRQQEITGTEQSLQAQRQLNAEMMRAQDIRKNTTDVFSQQVKAYISFTLGLSSMIRMIRESFRFIVDLDRALTEISTTTKKSTEETLKLAEAYNKMGQEMGKSTSEIAKASAVFFRQGKSDAEVASLMKSVIMGAALEGTSIEETAGRVTAALNAYKLGASDAQNVMSKFAAVGAAAATDFGKLSYALTKVGAGANLAGVSMDHLLGILATTLDVLQEA